MEVTVDPEVKGRPEFNYRGVSSISGRIALCGVAVQFFYLLLFVSNELLLRLRPELPHGANLLCLKHPFLHKAFGGTEIRKRRVKRPFVMLQGFGKGSLGAPSVGDSVDVCESLTCCVWRTCCKARLFVDSGHKN
jgi:hypothetical protein